MRPDRGHRKLLQRDRGHKRQRERRILGFPLVYSHPSFDHERQHEAVMGLLNKLSRVEVVRSYPARSTNPNSALSSAYREHAVGFQHKTFQFWKDRVLLSQSARQFVCTNVHFGGRSWQEVFHILLFVRSAQRPLPTD